MYRAGRHRDLCMMSTTFSQSSSWMATPAIFILQGTGAQTNPCTWWSCSGKDWNKAPVSQVWGNVPQFAALVSLFAFMQAHGHAAVVIIIFMVRGGLESCLSTVNYTGIAQVWDLWPALEYYLICKDGNLQTHINTGGFAPWSQRFSCFLAQGAKGRRLACPTLVSDPGLRRMCSPGVTELLCLAPAHHPQQAMNLLHTITILLKPAPHQIISPEGSLPRL